MESFGIIPEPEGLDFDLGHFAENFSDSIAQLVACKGKTIIGSIILKKKSPTFAKLTGFYVNPEFHGQGVGKGLLNEVINRARKNASDGIYLSTCDNMESAIHLYNKYGWKRISDPPKNSGAQRSYYLNLNIKDPVSY